MAQTPSDIAWQSARIDRLEELLAERDDKIAEAAAFLDGMADRLQWFMEYVNYKHDDEFGNAAAECRAMADKMRGET